MRLHLSSSEYREVLQNEASPISTTTLAERCTQKLVEEFEEMHRKLKLNIETNEMKKFGGIKNDLKEGDQLWIFHKRWMMRSYAQE